MRAVCEIMQSVPVAQEMLGGTRSPQISEVDELLQIYFTIPVTTATAERSFSALCRIKTYLRSTMSDERLNNVMLLHVHKHRSLCHVTSECKDILGVL